MNVGRCHRGSRPCRGHAMKGLIAASALLGSAFLTAAAAAPEAAVASHDKVAAVMKGDRLSLTTSNSSWATVVRELAAQTGIAFRVAPVPRARSPSPLCWGHARHRRLFQVHRLRRGGRLLLRRRRAGHDDVGIDAGNPPPDERRVLFKLQLH